MKKLLRLLKNILMILAILILAFAALNFYIAINTHDGTAQHYHQMYQSSLICLIAGVILLILAKLLSKAIRKKH